MTIITPGYKKTQTLKLFFAMSASKLDKVLGKDWLISFVLKFYSFIDLALNGMNLIYTVRIKTLIEFYNT